jgi:hypothetical protein
MSDSFTETTRTGWFSRIGNSFKGILFGIILFVAAFPLLWWNEGRSVKTADSLAEGEKITVAVASDKVDSANDGKLVHLSGRAEAKDMVKDDVFGVTAPGLVKLQRIVELFQWIETKSEKTEKRVGGSEETVTTYNYKTGWDAKVYNSSGFRHPDGHKNPEPAYNGKQFYSEDTHLGAFRLPGFLISDWNSFKPHALPTVEALPEPIRAKATAHGEWLYVGGKPDAPKVGDARVKFESVPPGDASVLGRQTKDTLEEYKTSNGYGIARIADGVKSKEAMFAAAKAENNMLMWLLRIAGFVLMWIGLTMVLNPLRVVADVVPFIGRIVGGGTGIVAALIAAMAAFIIIGLAWVWYRPLLGITLLLLAVGAGFLLAKRITKGKAIGVSQ